MQAAFYRDWPSPEALAWRARAIQARRDDPRGRGIVVLGRLVGATERLAGGSGEIEQEDGMERRAR